MTASWYVLELETAKTLRADGYWTIRAPGSKGHADTVALKPGPPIEIVFIQCKETDLIPPGERTRLLDLAASFSGVALWARWVKVGRAARTVEFRQLTGPGPRDWQPWTANHALEASNVAD